MNTESKILPIVDLFAAMGNIQPDALCVLLLVKDYINKGANLTEQERVSAEARIGLGLCALYVLATIRILEDKNEPEKN